MKTAWAFAKAADEIISFAEKLIEESEALTKKEQGVTPPKSIN
jgi:hypothetical protein